ncbi:MAG: flavodoxin family protein [bacterium]
MKKSIVYSTVTGNARNLGEHISKTLGDSSYCGPLSDEAIEADLVFVGFWTTKFSCDDKVKAFLGKLKDKKVFLYGTAGYDFTEEFFNGIIEEVKKSVDPSCEVVGSFMCQGKVSDAKQKAIKDADEEKYNSMKENLDKSVSHPDASDLDALAKAIQGAL